jgi:methyl-accepting chemotaxis protein
LKHLPIIVKFLAILACFGVFGLCATSYMAAQMRGINDSAMSLNNTLIKAEFDVSRANRAQQTALAALEWSLMTTAAADDQASDAEYKSNISTFDSAMAEAAALVPAQADAVNALKQRGDNIVEVACAKTEQMAVASTTAQGNLAAQAEFLANCQPGIPQLTADLSAERQTLDDMKQAELQQISSQTNASILWSLVAVLVSFSAVLAAGFAGIRGWVVTPLKNLEQVMERLAGGELGVTVPACDRRDEIGAMARAVQVFKDTGAAKQQAEAAAQNAEAAADAERERGEAAREAAAAAQARVVEGLADGLEKLSKGDLPYRLRDAFPTEYEKLRTDFNGAMETLQRTMQAIAGNTSGVRASAGEITQSSDDLSRRTEQQAASLEETAAALDEITATVRKTAEGANEARDVVGKAREDAERSGNVVKETVTAMAGIEESSRQISNIIGVIDEIAFQTNLLALNAGVEAARAGDAGRGFAVVATEVRALAQRSADAAKEIKGLITTSGAQVQSGVRLVGQTGEALARIVAQVERLNMLVSDIAASAVEQATGLAEVNAAVNQMDQVTQQNAAMVEEATAGSHALEDEARELARLVGQFQIGEGTAASQARGKPAAAVLRPGVVSARPKAAPTAPVGRFVKLSTPTVHNTENWDEF